MGGRPIIKPFPLAEATVGTFCMSAPCDPLASGSASTLLEGLRRVGASETFLFGHQNTGWSNQNAQSRLLESDVSRATNGDFPAVVGFNLAQIRNRNLRTAVEQALRRGSVLTFSWEAPNPVTGGSSRDVSGNPMRELLPGGSANEKVPALSLPRIRSSF